MDPRSPLLAHPRILRLIERMRPAATHAEIAAAIRDRTGVTVTAGQVRAYVDRSLRSQATDLEPIDDLHTAGRIEAALKVAKECGS